MAEYLGNGALNRFMCHCTTSFEHDCKATRSLSEKVNHPVLVWTLVWLFYLVKIIVYFFCIFGDLLTGHPLLTTVPEINIEIGETRDIPKIYNPHNKRKESYNEITELLRKEKPVIRNQQKQCVPQIQPSKTQVKTDNVAELNEAMTFIKDVLKANKGTLKGVILDTKERKIPAEELLQFNSLGYLQEPAIKQFVSFGSIINEKLHIVLGNDFPCKYIDHKKGNYFILNDCDYTPIVDKLNGIYGVNCIKVNLTGCQ